MGADAREGLGIVGQRQEVVEKPPVMGRPRETADRFVRSPFRCLSLESLLRLHPADSNQSQSMIEPVSVGAIDSRRERVGGGWRLGEGRILVLMRGRGMKRCRAEGAERFALFVAAAVLVRKPYRSLSKNGWGWRPTRYLAARGLRCGGGATRRGLGRRPRVRRRRARRRLTRARTGCARSRTQALPYCTVL
jgi:hypothetical protein